MANTLEEVEEHELDLVDGEGHVYVGRVTGALVAEDYPLLVYLTVDERVLVYNDEKLGCSVLENPVNDLREILGDVPYTDALFALGEKPVVDL